MTVTQNKIKQFRSKRGMTQRQLAGAVGTSQQQIQRIESGVQAARFEVALKICAALDASMEQVFPAARTILKKVASSNNDTTKLITDKNHFRRSVGSWSRRIPGNLHAEVHAA